MTEKNRIQSVMPASLLAELAERTVYSYGVRAGEDLDISGLVPFASDGTIVGEGDIDAQVEQVFANMRAVVEEAGVAALARPQFLVEISAIAHLG